MRFNNPNRDGKGKIDSRERIYFIKENGNKCQLCGFDKIPTILIIHHISRKADGGKSHRNNLQILCPNCHAIKHLLSNESIDDKIQKYRNKMQKYMKQYREK
jgi:5-methylcytosine-specific restriction endonuclease McrA